MIVTADSERLQRDHGTNLPDTHDQPIRSEVWTLYEHIIGGFGRLTTLIEWDDNIPEFEVLAAAAAEARRQCDGVLSRKRAHTLIHLERNGRPAKCAEQADLLGVGSRR
jgi:uncharacterized protein (UPF0276 family)